MTLRRVFFILLIHFVVMVGYPHYGIAGFSFGMMSAVIWSLGAIAVSIIITLLAMEKWDRLNKFITVALVILCAWFLLAKLPQEDKVAPLKKITYGDFPKGADIKDGLKNFGLNWDALTGWVRGARSGAQRLNNLQDRTDRALKEAAGE